jgi:hypothetical protein
MSSKSRIIYLVLLIAVFAALLGYLLVSISSARRSANEAYAESLSLSGNDSWTREVRMIQNELQSDLAALDEAAITQPELISLIESLEKTGREMGLKVLFSSITAEGEQSSTTPQTVKMTVDTEGSWSASLAFVNLLEHLPVKSSIENSNLNVFGKAWRSGTTLRVTVFPENI